MIHLKKRMMSAAAVAVAMGGLGIAAAAPAQAATSTSVWDAVAQCESSGDWSINTGNGFYGGLQFSASTWNEFGGTQYASRADLATKAQQIAIAQKVLAVQGPNAWPVCSKVAGLTSSNGGTSSSTATTSTSSSGTTSSTASSSTASSNTSTSTSTADALASSGSTGTSSKSSAASTDATAKAAAKKATNAAKAKAYPTTSHRHTVHHRSR